jgi:hypothetical protein
MRLKIYYILLVGIALRAGSALATLGVDWGGSYGNSFSSTLSQGLGGAVTSIGDYTFDAVSDAAYRIPFGTVYSPSVDNRYLAPAGKTGPLYTGLQVVNHSSSTAPTNPGIYRWNASTNPNQLNKTNPGSGTGTQSMSVSYFSKKVDFLNGLNTANGISFANAADAAKVTLSVLRNNNAGTATIAFLAQEGSDWFVTVATNRTTAGSDYAGTLTVNPYTANWYAYNPSSNQFLIVTNLGPGKAGSTFTNITAFGVCGQSMGYDGSAANSQKLDFTGFSGSFTAVFGTAPGTIDDVLNQTVVRQETTLARQLTNPYPSIGLWRDEDFALGAYGLNISNALADAALIACATNGLYQDAITNQSFHWHAYLQERILFLYSSQSAFYPGRMSTNAENAVLEMLWDWASPLCDIDLASTNLVDWYWGSENHHLQAWVSFWGAAHVFKNHPDYQNRTYADGSTPAQMAAAFDAYFKAYVRDRASKGLLVEVASPTYAKYSLNTLYNLVDFADDPELKEGADVLLDIYWADWAVQQIDGMHGGGRIRCYPDSGFETSGGPGTGWYHFGIGDPPGNPHPGFMCAATTLWRPSRAVAGLALDAEGRGSYEYMARRPGLKDPAPLTTPPSLEPHSYTALDGDGGHLLNYTWCTPDFLMGMSEVDLLAKNDWSPASSQNHWNGVIFAGHATARIFTQPYEPADGSSYNTEWGVQKRGVRILQRLHASNAQGQRIWFDDSLTRVEMNGWIFAEAPRAYAAVRVVDGGGSWQAETNYPAQGQWLVLTNEFSPIIMEVAPASAFSTFSEFQSSILSNTLAVTTSRVDYNSAFYDTTLTLFSDQSRLPLVNGIELNTTPEKVYDSPYLQGDFDSGVVIINYETNRTVLGVSSFSADTNTIALWHFDTTLPTVNAQSTDTVSIVSGGKFGNAVRCDFEEGDQYMMSASSGWPTGIGTFRYQGWIRLGAGDDGGFLFHVYDQVYLSVTTSNATFKINKSGVATDVSATNLVECSAAISTANEWQYIEAFYDGAILQLITEQQTVSVPGIGKFVPNIGTITIGSRKNKDNFVGWMDEVRISAAIPGSSPDPQDFDGDWLPDRWEAAWFARHWAVNGLSDSDGDGFINLYEYRAGTSPIDSASLLKLNRLLPGISAVEWDVSWQSVAGKMYRVLSTTNLLDGTWTTNAAGVSGTAPETSQSVTAGGATGFFRIETE